MYSFEGEFRRKPTQSLGGASRKEHRLSLLNRASAERQKREDIRKQNQNALKIQSHVRALLARLKFESSQRKEFDDVWKLINNKQCVDDEKIIGELLQRLIIFFQQKADRQRLISVCQILLKRHTLITRAILSNVDSLYIWRYRIKKILLLNLNMLIENGSKSEPIATSMRILEVFTSCRTYEKLCTADQAAILVINIFHFLLKNGFYKKLKKLMVSKVPDSLIKSPTPPTELAATISNLMLAPLHCDSAKDNVFRLDVLREITDAFLSCEFTPHISCFVLPMLTCSDSVINFKYLLLAIYDADNDKMLVQSSIYLLYSILLFFEAQNDIETFLDDLNYVFVLNHLSKTIPAVTVAKNDSDSDDEDADFMETESSTELNNLVEECIQMVNKTKHVEFIISTIDRHETNSKCVAAICNTCHSLLSHSKFALHSYRLLYTLAFKTTFLRRLWDSAASSYTSSIFGSKTPLLQVLARGFNLSSAECDLLLPQLAVFCSLFSYLLVTVHDSELGSSGKNCSVVPFTLKELIGVTLMLRDVCLGLIELAYPDTRSILNEGYQQAFRSVSNSRSLRSENTKEQAEVWAYMFKVVVNLVRQLHSRDTRRPFCPEGHWLTVRVTIPHDKTPSMNFRSRTNPRYLPFRGIQTFTREELEEEGPPLSTAELRIVKVLRELPFVISFTERVKIFHQLINNDKAENQALSYFRTGPMIRVVIRRDYIYEDAFEKLSRKNEENLKLKLTIQLINAAGLDEAGIDGGGIFREFLNILLKAGFDPNRGYFLATADESLYPNPHVHLIEQDFTEHFYFLGRMLGKAIYENMLVELPFAAFFLLKLLGKHSTSVDIHHLDSLDPLLYKNLMYLKSYEGDVSSLGIDFTVTNSDLGEMQTVELKPDGANIPVTSANAIEYIHLVSDYKLNKQIQEQCNAFKQGLGNVINLEWLQMFDYRELQVLISGASVPIDLDNLKKHTVYSSDYKIDHPVIVMFWNVVEQFTQDQLKKLLKFVTSCSRPPLLGFKELSPSFCIQNGGNEVDRLPTASTCMNLLKLPEFKDEETLRQKLLYAIESDSGFELS